MPTDTRGHDEPPIIVDDGGSLVVRAKGLETNGRTLANRQQLRALSVFHENEDKSLSAGKIFAEVRKVEVEVTKEKGCCTLAIEVGENFSLETAGEAFACAGDDPAQRSVQKINDPKGYRLRIAGYTVTEANGNMTKVNTRGYNGTFFSFCDFRTNH